MQLSEVLCYALLTITVTATCVQAGRSRHWGRNVSKKVRKRDTAVMVDSYPSGKGVIKQPRFIYSKIRKHRRGKPGLKHAASASSYASIKYRQKPGKYRPQRTHAANTKQYKKRTIKPNYGRSKRPFPAHGSSRPKHFSNSITNPAGFAEPPPQYAEINVQKPNSYDHLFKIMSTEMTYGDPPVDSYGAPLQQLPSEDTNIFSKPPKAPNLNIFDEQEVNFGYEHDQWRNSRVKPTGKYVDYTKPYTVFANPVTKHPLKTEDLRDSYDHQNHEVSAISYSDIYNYGKHQNILPYEVHQERPKQPNRFHANNNKIVVGGQYAEPPARYVPELRAVPTMISEGAEPHKESIPSVSSYINYKYGNMAFSPQNLNDAFGTNK